MSKTNLVFKRALARYAKQDFEPPRALLERPNTIIYPALQEPDEFDMNLNAALGGLQGGQAMDPMAALMGGMGMGMGGDPGMGGGPGMEAAGPPQEGLPPGGPAEEEMLP